MTRNDVGELITVTVNGSGSSRDHKGMVFPLVSFVQKAVGP